MGAGWAGGGAGPGHLWGARPGPSQDLSGSQLVAAVAALGRLVQSHLGPGPLAILPSLLSSR